jgi:hypothetical protein
VRRGLAVALGLCGFLIAGFMMLRVFGALYSPTYRSAARVWPFPGLYLVEVVALAFAVLVVVLAQRPRAFVVAWAALGALTALTLLGAMTVGPFIGVSLLALIPATVLANLDKSTRWRHVSAFGLGLALQAGLMLAVIQVMRR